MAERVEGVIHQAVREGLQAAKTNLLPGSFLIGFGILLVVAYYQVEWVGSVLNRVGELKARYGFGFSMVSTAFFGGILPLLVRRALLGRGWTVKVLLFHIGFWAYKGVEVDLLYRIQAAVFGHGRDPTTILKKVLVDEFVYVPFIAVPTMVLGYLWKDCEFSLRQTRAALREQTFLDRCIRLMISNWGVWIPAVAIIYLFPLVLQLPLQNITLTLWVMLLIVLTEKKQVGTE